MTDSQIPLIVRRTISAERERVFDAFSNAESLSHWFTPHADIIVDIEEFTFEIGGRFRFRYRMPDGRRPTVSGVYECIESPVRIGFSWIWQAPDPLANIPMRILVELVDNGGETEVAITHEGLPSDRTCSIHESGWEAALISLQRYLDLVGRKTVAQKEVKASI